MSASGLHMLAHLCTLNTHTLHTERYSPPYHTHIYTLYIIHTLHTYSTCIYIPYTLNTIHRHYTHAHYIHMYIHSTTCSSTHTAHTYTLPKHTLHNTLHRNYRHPLHYTQTLHTLCSHTHTHYTHRHYIHIHAHTPHPTELHLGPSSGHSLSLASPPVCLTLHTPQSCQGCPRIPNSRIKPATPVHQMLHQTLPSTP